LYLIKISTLESHITEIRKLLTAKHFPNPVNIKELPSSGSDRIYFRVLFNDEKPDSLIAAYNPDVSENIAWYSFSLHFHNQKLNVPEIYACDESYRYFLLQDLGNETLFDALKNGTEEDVKKYYQEVIINLIKFQVKGIRGLDLDVAYPVKEFDRQSILWDLNYFKYYFIKPNNIGFNERTLEDEFQALADRLLEPRQDFFLYRDFQARNIMIHQNQTWFIDFQGGRKGPLQYDLVSLLYQARANLSEEFRDELYQYYLTELEKEAPGISNAFNKHFNYFIYFRLMQVLGAYGFRGIIQRKGHFLESIPSAINNLKYLLKYKPLLGNFETLNSIYKELASGKDLYQTSTSSDKLTVLISSFSYKKNGYPVDRTENGGGFVFDCRALPNPGRIQELKDYTGLEKPVIDYLSGKPEVKLFLNEAFHLVDRSVENYLERGFNYLSVNFGCTGGKHRSVFSTEQLKMHISKYGNRINIKIKHIQLDD